MKRALVFVTGKGGLGKSTAGRWFTDAARLVGRRVAAWDLDAGTGSMAIFYESRDPLSGCAAENVRNPKSPGAWLDSLHSDADDVVLDVPGGGMPDLLRFMDGAAHLIDEMKQAGREVVIVSIVGTQRDSTMAPQVAIDTFGSAVHHVVIKNGFFGDSFLVYDGFDDPETGKFEFGNTVKVVREIGADEIFMPKVNTDAMQILDVKNMTFAEGAFSAARIGRRWSGFIRYWMEDMRKATAGTWLSADGEVGDAATAADVAHPEGAPPVDVDGRKAKRRGEQVGEQLAPA